MVAYLSVVHVAAISIGYFGSLCKMSQDKAILVYYFWIKEDEMIIPNTLFVSLYLSMVLRALFRNDGEHLCDDDHLRDFKCKAKYILCLKEEKNI